MSQERFYYDGEEFTDAREVLDQEEEEKEAKRHRQQGQITFVDAPHIRVVASPTSTGASGSPATLGFGPIHPSSPSTTHFILYHNDEFAGQFDTSRTDDPSQTIGRGTYTEVFSAGTSERTDSVLKISRGRCSSTPYDEQYQAYLEKRAILSDNKRVFDIPIPLPAHRNGYPIQVELSQNHGIPLLTYCRLHRIALTPNHFRMVLQGLKKLHLKNAGHGDLKPDNILISEQNSERVKQKRQMMVIDNDAIAIGKASRQLSPSYAPSPISNFYKSDPITMQVRDEFAMLLTMLDTYNIDAN